MKYLYAALIAPLLIVILIMAFHRADEIYYNFHVTTDEKVDRLCADAISYKLRNWCYYSHDREPPKEN